MFRISAVVIVIVLLAGCATSRPSMRVVGVLPTNRAMARLVFLRSAWVGSAIDAPLYETTGGRQDFLGIARNKTHIVVDVSPGHHQFMVIGENADFIEAHVAAGHVYHVLVSPRIGWSSYRFSLLPIRPGADAEYSLASDDFKEWMRGSVRVEPGDEAWAWARANDAEVTTKREFYAVKWERMLPVDKQVLTIGADDGVQPDAAH